MEIVIIGGGMIGSSIAWWTARDPDFRGRITVIERDPTYVNAASSLSHSCIRAQFGSEVNVRLSMFGAEFVNNFRDWMQDPEAPDILLQSFGYLYLADNQGFADVLRDNAVMQRSLGAQTRILTPDEIQAKWPFMAVDGLLAGSHNPLNEGYFDGATVFDWFRRKAKAMGVTYLHDEATGFDMANGRVTGVCLASGRTLPADQVVNAAGTRAGRVAEWAGLHIPCEPRNRYSVRFAAERFGQDVPLTINPNGTFVRTDGDAYLSGCTPEPDLAREPDDFTADYSQWEEVIWPSIAERIPAFERLKVLHTWVGQYDYNTLDQNAILGPFPSVPNLHIANGFSGHGFQQGPGVGRGMAERLIHGEWRSIDLTPLEPARILANTPLRERAII